MKNNCLSTLMPPKKKRSAVGDDEYEPPGKSNVNRSTTTYPLANTLVQDSQNEAAQLIASAERDGVRLDALARSLKRLSKAVEAADRAQRHQRCGGCAATEFGSDAKACFCGESKFCTTCAQDKSHQCADPYQCENLICSRSKCSRECEFCKKTHCMDCLKQTKCYSGYVCFACRTERKGCFCSLCMNGFSSDEG